MIYPDKIQTEHEKTIYRILDNLFIYYGQSDRNHNNLYVLHPYYVKDMSDVAKYIAARIT